MWCFKFPLGGFAGAVCECNVQRGGRYVGCAARRRCSVMEERWAIQGCCSGFSQGEAIAGAGGKSTSQVEN